MTEYIKPGINLNGVTYNPPGWMYVIGFALGGCEWALKEVDTKEFKNLVKQYQEQEDAEWTNNRIDKILLELEELKTK